MNSNQIASSANHCLHLCRKLDVDGAAFSYLMDADVFVTSDVETWGKKFSENEINCKIKKPNEVTLEEKIVVDGASLVGNDLEKWEKKWEKQKKAVCIYDIDELEPSLLKSLVKAHDKMLLSADKIRMLSHKDVEKEIDNLDPKIVENLVKRELKNIVISLLLSKPMCGTELVKVLYGKFKVFISPGMLYPALHDLEKKGLLKYEYKLKNKVYSVQEKEQAKLLLKNHTKANSVLSQFLVSD